MNIHKKILYWTMYMILPCCVTGCISNAEVVKGQSYPLAVSVSDYGFTSASGTKATTRATESGYVTTFAKGDQIGLFVVNSSNTVETANLCLTYDGTKWNYPTGTILYYDNTANKRYFAYYPYQSTLTGAPTTSIATDAATFFATAIADWTPATDQSSQVNYTASDLMVGTGSIGALLSNVTRPMSFNMNHQMALVDMNFPYYYLSTDNNYTYTLGLTCNGFKPLHISNGNYRYIIKPATSTSIWGYYCTTTSANTNQIFNKAFTVSAGTYQTMNVDNTATSTSYTMNIGDYYLNDGSVIPNATTNKYLLSKAIGVVFDTSTSTTDQGYGWTHGYALALTNAATNACWSLNENDEALTNYQGGYTTFISNKDGYTESQTIKNNGHDAFTKDNYPAFWYALNYGTNNEPSTTSYASPKVSSGWFLPSIGQWYDIVTNLGNLSTTPTNYGTGNDISWCQWYDVNGSNYPSICATNINNYLSTLKNSGCNTDYFSSIDSSDEIYVPSTEYSLYFSYFVNFCYNNNQLNLDTDYNGGQTVAGNTKNVNDFIVRTTIAF